MLIFLALFLLRRGFVGIWEINDFEVIRHGVVKAIEGSEDVYQAPSIEGRHYLYPPVALPILLPLGIIPYHVSGVIFTLLRLASLCFIIWLPFRMVPHRDIHPEIYNKSARVVKFLSHVHPAWLIIIALVPTFRYINSSFGNGQINILLAALVFGGLYLAGKKEVGKKFSGGILVGLATLVKATPLIFILPLFFRKKWKAITGFAIISIIISVIAWFWLSPHNAVFWSDWRLMTRSMAYGAVTSDRIVSLPETITAICGHFNPDISHTAIFIIFLISLFAGGLLILFVRLKPYLNKSDSPPLWYDASFFFSLSLILSPMIRKSHLAPVVFIFLSCLLHTIRRLPEKTGYLWWLGASAFLFFAGESLNTENFLPGKNANFTLFLAMVTLLISLWKMPLDNTPHETAQ